MADYLKISSSNILHKICKYMKIFGVGDYWHENSKNSSLFYNILQCTMFLNFYIMLLLEVLEMVFNTYPTDLHNDTLAMGVAHMTVIARLHFVMYKKHQIREMHKFFIEECEGYEEEGILNKQYRKVVISVVLQIGAVAITVSCYLLEALRRRHNENVPLIILATYWPKFEDESYLALTARIGIYLILINIVCSMISLDTLAITHLIMLSFKFVNLQRYFANIRKDFESQDVTILELKRKCLDGILLHQKLTSLSKKIHDCFGLVMSVQIWQATGVAVLLLLKMAISTNISFIAIMTNLTFVTGLLIQLALYLWNAGEVTYQAAEMSTAIFNCGWHLRGARHRDERDLRRIVLMGCAQAQRPLVMKAFGLMDLSYQTFVSVVRATYSLFAILY